MELLNQNSGPDLENIGAAILTKRLLSDTNVATTKGLEIARELIKQDKPEAARAVLDSCEKIAMAILEEP